LKGGVKDLFIGKRSWQVKIIGFFEDRKFASGAGKKIKLQWTVDEPDLLCIIDGLS
jgi:hypothetical protein